MCTFIAIESFYFALKASKYKYDILPNKPLSKT